MSIMMRLRILSWNVRGANDPEKRRIIKAFIRSKKVDIVCLQETKLKEMTEGLIRSLGVGSYLDCASISEVGASDIVVFWDSRVFQLIGKEESQYTISCRFRTCNENNQRRACLDRFLVTEDWDACFRGVGQSLLQRPVSDHFPILLEGGGGLVRGPLPFRFENMWIGDESFKDLIKD